MKFEKALQMILTSFPRKARQGAVAVRVRRKGGMRWPISQRGAAKALSLVLSMAAVLLLLPAINEAASQRQESGAMPSPVAVAMPGLKPMGDAEMSAVSGQALFMSSHERSTSGTIFDFYKMGLDAQMDINVNIAELKLGEDTSGVDLWIKNFAMGCIGTTNNPLTADCIVAGSGTSEAGKVLKPFSLTRPFIQVAVKNDSNPALREVVGIRLGAQNTQGPFSAGNFNSFSGYMSGTAALTMQGQGKDGSVGYKAGGANGCTNNMCSGVALTNDSDFRQAGVRWDHLNQMPLSCASTSVQNTTCAGGYNFGFNNQYVDAVITGANTRTLLVGFDTVNTTGSVTASGKRLSQALVSGLNLANVVNTLGDTVTATASTSLGTGLLNTFLPFLIGQVKTDLKNQLATGLAIPYTGNVSDATLNNYKMPFNLENFHSTMVNSSLFGLSFQREAVQYPGYALAMQKGWSMYLPNAFVLDISAPTTILVSNIVASNADTAGNITGLPANSGGRVYDNCWGSSVFC